MHLDIKEYKNKETISSKQLPQGSYMMQKAAISEIQQARHTTANYDEVRYVSRHSHTVG
jgi:hypothetical protein